MNERGLRVRFLPWSGSVTAIQQDRLRKCSLATLVMPDELANGGIGTTTEDAFMPYAKGKNIMYPELTGSSLRIVRAPPHAAVGQGTRWLQIYTVLQWQRAMTMQYTRIAAK